MIPCSYDGLTWWFSQCAWVHAILNSHNIMSIRLVHTPLWCQPCVWWNINKEALQLISTSSIIIIQVAPKGQVVFLGWGLLLLYRSNCFGLRWLFVGVYFSSPWRDKSGQSLGLFLCSLPSWKQQQEATNTHDGGRSCHSGDEQSQGVAGGGCTQSRWWGSVMGVATRYCYSHSRPSWVVIHAH